ncbi:properdin [Gasterosteus aculeatus]|uniref:properdin-like n=1 Tax=Gasterosteus aculeatus aculeatus TaxID=481459 RepID=UPI001A985662|nr:properdin-like [Gasterosteus aculeatus aculeatus]
MDFLLLNTHTGGRTCAESHVWLHLRMEGRGILVLVLVLASVHRSEGVRCFARFYLSLGQCDEELGEVDEEDCCQNPQYGYQTTDGVCRSCGSPVWSPWSPWSQCNVPCGEGVMQRNRKCFGIEASECEKPKEKVEMIPCNGTCCQSPCPVAGVWSSWSSWSQCSSSCIPEDRAPIRYRRRTCSNPAPSTDPPGMGCHGDDNENQNCNNLPHCPVDGGWGSWSPFSSCPVTCGVGLQESFKRCDNPAPKHGGWPCPGEGRRTRICLTNTHCPVDGVWSDWSPWGKCTSPFPNRVIRCSKTGGGSQSRERRCLHQAHNGSICDGDGLTDTRVCYDVSACHLKGTWGEWDSWTLCSPPCGDGSRRFRRRLCNLDYSDYRPTIGLKKEPANFSGRPNEDCGPLPDGEKRTQFQNCVGAPACP